MVPPPEIDANELWLCEPYGPPVQAKWRLVKASEPQGYRRQVDQKGPASWGGRSKAKSAEVVSSQRLSGQ